MRLFQVFVTVVVVLCLIKLRWPKRKNERIFFLMKTGNLNLGNTYVLVADCCVCALY